MAAISAMEAGELPNRASTSDKLLETGGLVVVASTTAAVARTVLKVGVVAIAAGSLSGLIDGLLDGETLRETGINIALGVGTGIVLTAVEWIAVELNVWPRIYTKFCMRAHT